MYELHLPPNIDVSECECGSLSDFGVSEEVLDHLGSMFASKTKKKQKKALSSPNSDGLSIRHCHGDDEQLDSQHLSPSKLHTRRFMPKRPALSKAGQRVRGSGTTSHCSQIAIWMSMLQAIHQQSQLLGANYCTVPQVPWWPELILSKSS